MLTQTATFTGTPAVGADSEGNPTFGDPVVTTYPCRLEQTDSTEIVEGERRSVSNLLLFLPPEAADQSFEDTVDVDGRLYQVEGVPNVLRTPRGIHHIEARVRGVVG